MLTVAQGKPLRLVSVVNVLISNSRGQALTEAQQVLPSGAVRERRKPLSEKLLPGERWQDGVLRGIKEELGSILPADPEVGGWPPSLRARDTATIPLSFDCHMRRVQPVMSGGREMGCKRAW